MQDLNSIKKKKTTELQCNRWMNNKQPIYGFSNGTYTAHSNINGFYSAKCADLYSKNKLLSARISVIPVFLAKSSKQFRIWMRSSCNFGENFLYFHQSNSPCVFLVIWEAPVVKMQLVFSKIQELSLQLILELQESLPQLILFAVNSYKTQSTSISIKFIKCVYHILFLFNY